MNAGVLAGISRPASRRELGAERGRLLRAPLELDALVEVLGVLADHDEVDALVPRRDARERARRPHRREQVELLTQRDVDAAEAACPTGVVIGPLIATRVRRMLLEDAVGERLALALEDRRARLLEGPLDVGAGGVEHPAGRLGDLGADAVARDQRDEVRHARPYRPRRSEPVEQDRAFHVLDRLRHLDAARARLGAVEGRPAAEDAGLLGQDLRAAPCRPRRASRR